MPFLNRIKAALSQGGFCLNQKEDVMLIVGLGNPGTEYAKQRHNIGFMAVDAMADQFGFGPFKSKFQGDYADGRIGTQRVFLLKPMTYMNESGQSVGQFARFFKIPMERIIVIHDELDLDPGQVKIKTGGGHAGHNGLRSLDAHLGTQNYKRLRLGIGHPGSKERVHGHVLGNFSAEDKNWLDKLLSSIAQNADWLIKGEDSKFIERVK